jgi:hypothetical protein
MGLIVTIEVRRQGWLYPSCGKEPDAGWTGTGRRKGSPALDFVMQHRSGRRPLLGLAALSVLWGARPSLAATLNARDLQVVARAVAFMTPAPTGTVEVGIVHGDAGRAEAEALAATFGEGVRANAVTLRPATVTVAQATASPMKVLLLTPSALPQAGAIAGAVAGKAVLTVAPDVAAVERGLAVMAVRSEPRVEIFVSRAAAAASGTSFASAFRMMIQER